MKFRNQSGQIIIWVLLISAAVTALGLSAASLIDTYVKNNRTNREALAATDAANILRNILQDPAVCARNFGPSPGQSVTPSTADITTDIVSATGAHAGIIGPGGVDHENLIYLKSYQISKVSNLPQPNTMIAQLYLIYQKTDASGFGGALIPRKIPLKAETSSATGPIIACSAVGLVDDQYWVSQDGVDLQDFSAGLVGIGTTAPLQLLSVGRNTGTGAGTFNISSTGDVDLEPQTGEFTFRHLGIEVFRVGPTGDFLVTNPNGAIGIGKFDPTVSLDVQGNMKLGAPGACDAAHEGSMAYDYTSHELKVCAGTPLSWGIAGGSPKNFGICDQSGQTQWMTGQNADGSPICSHPAGGVPTGGSATPPPYSGGGGGGGGGCFLAGTQITMADGTLKPIETVRAGDLVLSYDEVTRTTYVSPVAWPLPRAAEMQNVYHLHMSNGTTIDVNAVHRIFDTEAQSWRRVDDLVKAFDEGARVAFMNQDGYEFKIVSVDREKQVVPVYNLEIQGLASALVGGRGHTYFADGFLVHNMKPNAE